MTLYELVRKQGREYVWIIEEKEVEKSVIEVETIPTANVYANFDMKSKVVNWWHEPSNCLCVVIR